MYRMLSSTAMNSMTFVKNIKSKYTVSLKTGAVESLMSGFAAVFA